MTGRRPSRQPRNLSLPPNAARLDADLADEFRFHLEERIEELMAQGRTREEATAEARRRFGDEQGYRRLTRSIDQASLRAARRADFLGMLLRETGRSLRLLWRQRAFSAIVFATLAISIGAATAMFAVLDSVLLRPLPYPDAQSLVSIFHPATVPGSGERRWGLSPGGYFSFATNNHSLQELGVYSNSSVTVLTGGDAELVRVATVSASLFEVLSAHAAHGRLIGAADDRPGAPPVVVLSHEYYQRRFGGDPSIVGSIIETSDGGREVIGVAAPGLTLPMPGPFASSANLAGFGVDLWEPLRLNPAGPFYNDHGLVGIGRLRAGATIARLQSELAAELGRFVERMPTAYSSEFMKQYNFRVEVTSLRDAVLGDRVPQALTLLFGSVLLVLLISAANVGNLFLVRMHTRRRESAVRTALGADRAHMAAHYLSESLILCVGASVAAVALARLALRVLLLIAPTNVPRLASVTLGWPGVVFAVGAGVVAGLVLGLVPLMNRSGPLDALRDQARGSSASIPQRLTRNVLIVGQVALSMVLLCTGGLLLQSFDQLRKVRPGFDPTSVLTFDFSLPFSEFDTREKALLFHQQLQSRIGALPGVTTVGGGAIPLDSYGSGCRLVFREGAPYAPGEQTPCVSTPTVLPGFFATLGIEVRGRIPTWSDVASRSQAAVVTAALANRLWPGEDPIGRGIASNGTDSDVWYRVVGVVPELRAEALDRPPTEAVFYPATALRVRRSDGELNDISYVVRTDGRDPLQLIPAIRSLLRELNPRVPLIDARTMAAVTSRSIAGLSFSMVMLGVAGAMGLLLSAVGLYGVVSFLVSERRSELGVRMALGAGTSDILRLVLMGSARLAVVGIAVGCLAAFATGRVLSHLLFEVGGTSVFLMTATGALILAIVALASWAPARRATRIDPVDTIRSA